jgi:hypothetical protein
MEFSFSLITNDYYILKAVAALWWSLHKAVGSDSARWRAYQYIWYTTSLYLGGDFALYVGRWRKSRPCTGILVQNSADSANLSLM